MYFHNCALQTCSIFFTECMPKHEAPCEMKCLGKDKDNATLQWASSRAYVLFSSWSCNNQCNPMQLIHPSARAHDRHFLRFSSHLLYILPSVRLPLRGEYFANFWGFFGVSELFLWVKNCRFRFAHAPQWISIGIARCIVSQQASRLTKCRLNLLVFTFVFQMNAVFHFCVQYTVVFVYIITFVDKKSEYNVGWRSWDVSQHANICFNL